MDNVSFPSLNGLTSIISNMELTHLDSETSNYIYDVNDYMELI